MNKQKKLLLYVYYVNYELCVGPWHFFYIQPRPVALLGRNQYALFFILVNILHTNTELEP